MTDSWPAHSSTNRGFRHTTLAHSSPLAQHTWKRSSRPGLSSQVLAVSCPTPHPEAPPKVHFPNDVPQSEVCSTPKSVEIKKEPGTEPGVKRVLHGRIAKKTSTTNKVRAMRSLTITPLNANQGSSSPMTEGDVATPVKRGRVRPRKIAVEIVRDFTFPCT